MLYLYKKKEWSKNECIRNVFEGNVETRKIWEYQLSCLLYTSIEVSGIEGVSKDQVKKSAKSQQTLLQKIMGDLGEIFAPIIPALICGGLILGFRNCIDAIQSVSYTHLDVYKRQTNSSQYISS